VAAPILAEELSAALALAQLDAVEGVEVLGRQGFHL